MEKMESINNNIISPIKELYYVYVESDRWQKIGNLPEVIEADGRLYGIIKRSVNNNHFKEVEAAIADLADHVEMQGFVYGFSYALNMITESM